MFDLYVTTAKGTIFRTLNSPYETRHAAALSVLPIIADKGVTIGEGKALARQVRDAELGVEVTHEGSGISFRTEESPATVKER